MEHEQKINLDLPQSGSPVLPRSWPHSVSAKPARREAKDDDNKSPMKASAQTPRARGEKLGDAFAALNSQDRDRASDMANAVGTGFRDAARRDEYEQSIANDPESLRTLGFEGVDRDYD